MELKNLIKNKTYKCFLKIDTWKAFYGNGIYVVLHGYF